MNKKYLPSALILYLNYFPRFGTKMKATSTLHYF